MLQAERYRRPYAIRLNRNLYAKLIAERASEVRAIGEPPSACETWHGWNRYRLR